jgi:hypothetical protein
VWGYDPLEEAFLVLFGITCTNDASVATHVKFFGQGVMMVSVPLEECLASQGSVNGGLFWLVGDLRKDPYHRQYSEAMSLWLIGIVCVKIMGVCGLFSASL